MASKATKAARTSKAAETSPTKPVDPIKEKPAKQGRGSGGKFSAYVPNDKDRTLVALGSIQGGTQDKIAKLIGVSTDTLRKYYSKEWEDGSETANLRVMGNLFRMATMTSNDRVAITAAIFWAKSRLGWKTEGGAQASGEMQGADGQTVKFTLKIGERGDDA